tara:strand:+ start:177 stop:638 length:462 start_codon:yes stop_codon:yes gene_type:complete
MRKKFILILIVFFSLSGCGYSPIYSGLDNKTFKLNILKIVGDNEMNNIVNLKLKEVTNQNSSNILDLNINTEFSRNIISKNKEGKATSYSLKTFITFEVINNNSSEEYVFAEEIKTQNMNNEFELKEYEKTVKSNFVDSKIFEFISQLSINHK